MIKAGIIGCGRQMSKLIQAIVELDSFEIVALCDTNSEAFDTVSSALPNSNSIYKTEDYRKLIDENDLDAVFISTPTFFHLEPAHYALEKGLDIFLEKPINLHIKDIDKFIERAAASKNIVQVGFPFHYAYFFNTVQRLLTEERLGKCKYIAISEHRGPFLGEWFYEKDKSGGAINDKLIHFFDISNTTFAPAKPIRVFASGSQHFYHKNMRVNRVTSSQFIVPNPDIIDHASVTVDYDDGSILIISLNMYQNQPIEGLELRFTTLKGEHIKAFGDGAEIKLMLKDSSDRFSNFVLVDKSDSDINGLNHPGAKEEMRHFAKHVIERTQPQANLYKARQAQIIAIAAEESVEEHKAIELDNYQNKKIDLLAKQKGWTKSPTFKLKKIINEENLLKKQEQKDWLENIYLGLRKHFPKKDPIKRLNRKNISGLVSDINKNSSIVNKLANINLNVVIKLPWDSMVLYIEDNKVTLVDKPTNGVITAEVSMTEKGYEGFIRNQSITRLYLSRDINVIGDLKYFQKNRQIFEILVTKIREFAS